ncbi:hypothetical protein ACFP3O_11155 [Paraburkholderia silvatlantica]|uniref:Uncharacterized protein n=1 Tax=Paraburkholderia silvatlantica TaxID=321895 RepID=A0ABR6FXN0_9BURK|nr:hypothetical protein [Paraburkholderia silvatlantica]MBB2932182.1 hypothetical protein [Paraburkholderia silvatlantica]
MLDPNAHSVDWAAFVQHSSPSRTIRANTGSGYSGLSQLITVANTTHVPLGIDSGGQQN